MKKHKTPRKPSEGDVLTKTEIQVYNAVVEQALCAKSIARLLDKSVRAIRFHLGRIYIKCGVSTNLELVVRHYQD